MNVFRRLGGSLGRLGASFGTSWNVFRRLWGVLGGPGRPGLLAANFLGHIEGRFGDIFRGSGRSGNDVAGQSDGKVTQGKFSFSLPNSR